MCEKICVDSFYVNGKEEVRIAVRKTQHSSSGWHSLQRYEIEASWKDTVEDTSGEEGVGQGGGSH